MNRKLLTLIILGIIPVIILPIYAADPSEKFTFQGVLKDSSSNLVTATKDITLDFYTASSGGTLRFSNLCNDTSVSSGLFTCTITNPYDNFFAQALFVEVKVADSDGGNSETLTPRIELVGTPYSISALKAGNNFDLLQQNLINVTSITSESSLNMTLVSDFTVDTRTFTVEGADNQVGIGTTNPSEILEVFSTGIENAQFTIDAAGGSPVGDTRIRIGQSGTGADLNGIIGWDFSEKQMQLYVSGESEGTVLNVDNGGNIGIGTSTPNYKLDIEGSDNSASVTRIQNSDTGTSADGLDLLIGASSSGTANCFLKFEDGSATVGTICGNGNGGITSGSAAGINMTLGGTAASDFTVDGRTFTVDSQNDRVGVGTTNPVTVFSVEDSNSSDTIVSFDNRDTGANGDVLSLQSSVADPGLGNCYINFEDSGAGVEGSICGDGDSGIVINSLNDVLIGLGDASGDTFQVDAANVFVVDSNSDRVGIGISSPETPLHVFRNAASTATMIVEQDSAVAASGMIIRLGDTTPATDDKYIIFRDSGDAPDGTISGNGAGGITITSTVASSISPATSHSIVLGTDAGDDFIVDSTTLVVEGDANQVGIGIANPISPLDIRGSGGDNIATLRVGDTSDDTNDRGIIVALPAATPASTDHFISFLDSGSGLDGVIIATGGGGVSYDSSSDKRLKSNIRDTVYSLDDLLNIQVRDYERGEFQLTQTGFIAQELYQVYPQIVNKGGDEISDPEIKDVWSLDYGKLTPLLVKAIQDQQSEIEQLKQIVCTDHPEAEICNE